MQISVLEEISKHLQALGPAVDQIKRVFLLLNPLSLLRWLECVVELNYSTARVGLFECRGELCDWYPHCSLRHGLSAELNCVTDTRLSLVAWLECQMNCVTNACIVPCCTVWVQSWSVWQMPALPSLFLVTQLECRVESCDRYLHCSLSHSLSAELSDRCPHCSLRHGFSAESNCVTDARLSLVAWLECRIVWQMPSLFCRTTWVQSWIVWQMIAVLLVAQLECRVELCDRWLQCSLLHSLSEELNHVTDTCIVPCGLAWIALLIPSLLLVTWLKCRVELCDWYLLCSLSHSPDFHLVLQESLERGFTRLMDSMADYYRLKMDPNQPQIRSALLPNRSLNRINTPGN